MLICQYVLLLPSEIDPGGRFHFLTVQGRYLFKKNSFTVSILPGARLSLQRTGHASGGVATNHFGGSRNRSLKTYEKSLAYMIKQTSIMDTNHQL